MQETKVQINAELWKQAVQQIQRLKQQNAHLRDQLRSTQPDNTNIKGRHSLTQTQNQLTLPPQQNQNRASIFKRQMSEWASSLPQKYFSKLQQPNEMKQQAPSEICRTFTSRVQSKQENQQKCKKKKQSLKQMGLIESICLFGPDEQQVSQQIDSRRMEVNNSLLYCSHEAKENFQVYGSYFYPEGQVACKNLKQSEAATQINQMIFRKNTKKEDCNLFLFRGDETNQTLKLQNQVISKINPGRWLCAFFVQFSDFQYISQDGVVTRKINHQQFQPQETKLQQTKFEQSILPNQHQQVKGSTENEKSPGEQRKFTNFIKSKYTLCIFTYFPFINVMEQLLSCLLDETKIKRVQRYADLNSMEAVTIKFFVEELKVIGVEIDDQLVKAPVAFEQQVEIKFGNFSMNFEISESKLDELLFSGWVYDIVKLFQKDLIYDIYTNIMTEQSICFVSQNMHLLSYVIFLFVCVLPFPFTYPHPCISQVFNFELLQSPFVVTAGINQSSKWVEESVGNYPKKIFIDLNDDECKVKGKKKLKSVRSEKLKKIFNTLYKKIESTNSPVPQIFKRKSNIIRPASKEENDNAIQFIRALQTFYSEEIFFHLPNPAIITFIRDKTQQKNETSKIFNLLKEIEKYLKESRKQKEKDQFVELLTQQQIFYVHMGIRYSLD